MEHPTIFCAGSTAASQYAAKLLGDNGFTIRYEPSEKTQYVLLDVPSLGRGETLRSGESLQAFLEGLPRNCILFGGNLDHPAIDGWKKVDILKNEAYLKENARITAYCALQIIQKTLPVTLEEASVLVVGWGRIGKVLTSLLIRLGAKVTVASRDTRSIASLQELGINAVNTHTISPQNYRLIVNTAPAPILSAKALEVCPETAKIDLASVKGLEGDDVIWARGLPGIHAPESSGTLIARTVLTYIKEGKQ